MGLLPRKLKKIGISLVMVALTKVCFVNLKFLGHNLHVYNTGSGKTFAVIASGFIFSSLGLQFFLDKNLVVARLVANGCARAVKYLHIS